MKKLLCILLAVMVFLSSSACTQESKVTVYIPESVAVNGPNGESTGVISYLFEEGWQTKKTFTLTYGGNTDVLGQNVPVMTYSDKCLVTEVSDVSRTESRYDDNGLLISQVTEYTMTSNMDKMETTYTYDAYGRLLTEKITTYFPSKDAEVRKWIYAYTDTEHGSEGKSTVNGLTKVRIYDKNYYLVRQSDEMDGVELGHIESEYDDYGNQILSVAYVNGKLVTKTETKYKAVEVSSEFAARFPQFKREK